jgi:acetyltransferase (GNAT) family protein
VEAGRCGIILMTLALRLISYADILDNDKTAELLKEYSEECSIPEIGRPNPQREIYASMEKSGLMYSFGVFDDDELVGFVTLLLFILPHYGKKIANVESLFLSKSHRNGSNGIWLMEKIEEWVKMMQCVGMLYNSRAGSRLESLLSSLPKYTHTNSVFLWKA